MNRLIVYTPQNRAGRHDGDEFAREAHALHARHGGELLELPEWPKLRRRAFVAKCQELTGADLGHMAYFGHGLPPSLIHFYGRAGVDEMAGALALCMSSGCTIALYSCLVGRTFAPLLCGALHRVGLSGARVLGHWTAGHTSKNPAVTLALSETNNRYLVSNKSDLWPAWVAALKTDFRFDFPTMTREAIEMHLTGADQTVSLRRSTGPLAAPTWSERK